MEKQDFNQKVLIVSNHQTTGPLWVFTLQQQKLDVVLEAVPANVFQRWSDEIPDLIVLDIAWPENLLLELVKKLRAEAVVPILLLTNATSEDFLLDAYAAGVDETILRPMSPSLFLAKIKVWLRRAWTVPTDALDPLKVGKLQLQPDTRSVVLNSGEPIQLTNLEFRLLYFLMSRSGRAATAEDLIHHVWGYSNEADTTVLKNLVYRIRRKIEQDPANPIFVQTVPGVGYKVAAE